MSSLVADYGTSSGESDSDEEPPPTPKEEIAPKLPKPDFCTSSSVNSVFKNPFVEAENAKTAILEKHVKMVPTKDKVEMINGKKICWNYRKGRCRFGHLCTFAHDSDLQSVEAETAERNHVPKHADGSKSTDTPTSFTRKSKTLDGRKKRPGLSDNIVPSKKTMKMYKQNKSKNGN